MLGQSLNHNKNTVSMHESETCMCLAKPCAKQKYIIATYYYLLWNFYNHTVQVYGNTSYVHVETCTCVHSSNVNSCVPVAPNWSSFNISEFNPELSTQLLLRK